MWFFASTRFQGNKNYVGGMYENANAYDPTKWLYVPDFSRQATYATTDKSVNARITVQATGKDKLNFYWQEAKRFWQNAQAEYVSGGVLRDDVLRSSISVS